MKTLKLDHELAELVRSGQKTSTWRLFDDKNLSVGDEVEFVDKMDPMKPESWQIVGNGVITRVLEQTLGSIAGEDASGHEMYTSIDEMLTTYRGYYGNDVSLTTPVKIIHFTFKPTRQIENEENTTLSVKNVQIFTDGGSRGNPGPSACGYVIIEPNTKKVIAEKGIYLGVTTNNQAEYLALKFALEAAQKLGAREIEVCMDSLLVVNQMKGLFKIKNRDLWPIHDAITQLVAGFGHVSFRHVPREQNTLADAVVNGVLDEHQTDIDTV